MKFCKDCKYLSEYDNVTCKHPLNEIEPDPVTGKRQYRFYASVQRLYTVEQVKNFKEGLIPDIWQKYVLDKYCGNEARFFEEIEYEDRNVFQLLWAFLKWLIGKR